MAAHKPLTFRIRAERYSQLAQLEMAGLPFDRALDVLQLDEPTHSRLPAMRALVKHHDLAPTGERSGLFSQLEAPLIHASINAGSPARMYRQLAEFLQYSRHASGWNLKGQPRTCRVVMAIERRLSCTRPLKRARLTPT